MIYCTVYTSVGDFSSWNILSTVPLLPVYPGGPTNQRTNSKKQRRRSMAMPINAVAFVIIHPLISKRETAKIIHVSLASILVGE